MYKSMATKKRGLGQGIDSLIPNKVNANKETETVKVNAGSEKNETDGIFVNINKVEPNREQPRKNFDEDSLVDLSESIKQVGVLQPLLVLDKKDYYEIIAGERRWRAAKLAGLKEVPVRIMNLTDQEVVEISLVENIQRENLNPIEEAFAYKRLLTEFHLKQDEVAERVSKSRTAVTNSMRLLKLDERVQQMVIDDMITTGHARALLGIEDAEKQFATAQKIFDENLSVRETEKLVKKIQNNKDIPVEKKKVSDPVMEAIYHDLEEKMKSILGTKVAINKKDDQKGKIETISGVINANTGAVSIRATFPNSNHLLRSGGMGNLIIPYHMENALVVPQKATTEIQDKKFVFLQQPDNTVKMNEITILNIDNGQEYVVTSGLKQGDLIVIENVGTLKDGQTIKPTTPAQSEANFQQAMQDRKEGKM